MKRAVLKKMTGLLMSVVLAASLAGCGSGAQESGNAPAAESTTQEDSPAAEGNSGAEDAGESETADAAGGETVTITLWSQFSDSNSTDGNYVAFYNALESIKTDMPNVNVVHEGTESESYKVKLKTAMAGNELPDVFFNWGAGTMAPYVEAGLVLPMDDYITDEVSARILGGTLDNFTFDGKMYGYPYSVAVASLYVNTELFEQNNVKIPETYDEFLEAVV